MAKATTKNDGPIEAPDESAPRRSKRIPWNNAEFLCWLRFNREGRHFYYRVQHFFCTPMSLNGDLPLPDYPTTFSYPLYRVEQLQDLCNKATVIYGTDGMTWGEPFYRYINDIKFSRFFAKYIETSRSNYTIPTTNDILQLHNKVLEEADTAKANGFSKDDPTELQFPSISDINYKANHLLEYFSIKPLCRALIVILEHSSEPRRTSLDFARCLIRLVRTECTAGLSQPLSFETGLQAQTVISENEVVVLLPEAIRFIMDLDEREETLKEKRDPTVLETWLGDPEESITSIEKAFKPTKPMSTAGFWPTGPATEWWKLAKTLEEKCTRVI